MGTAGGREGSSGVIIMELALVIKLNQFKACFLDIKLHYLFHTPGPERASGCLSPSHALRCVWPETGQGV